MTEIRLGNEDDAAALSLLGAATFLETYAEKIAGGDIVAHCLARHSQEVYRAWLSDAEARVWIAQTASGAAIGYVVLTQATLPGPRPHAADLEIQRIYLLARYQGCGIGYRLMTEALLAAQERQARQVVLGVLKTNKPALAFYQRQGFVVIGARRFEVGASVFDDHVLGRRCNPEMSSTGGAAMR